MSEFKTIGFIGLGVMGEPICRSLAKKSGARVVAFDLAAEPLQRLRAEGAEVAASVGDVAGSSDIVFLCLPSAKHVRAVFEDGIEKLIRQGQIVVDLGTSSVSQTRDFAGLLQAKGVAWLDAPIARTRQAALDGTLSVMVGGPRELYDRIEPVIRCFATDVTHCGDVGAGQVTKILNNMGYSRPSMRSARRSPWRAQAASIRNCLRSWSARRRTDRWNTTRRPAS